MKNQIANIKRNYKSESMKTLFVLVGFLSGQALAKGFDWLAGKYPQFESIIKYGKPIVISGGGWLLSSATADKSTELKHMGYGLSAAGGFEGIKLIPIAKSFFEGESGTPGVSGTYYMESEKPMLELGQFGINALPIKSLDMDTAPETRLELPVLEGGEEENISGSDLGYDPERFEGLI
jgi:hypothetical protein